MTSADLTDLIGDNIANFPLSALPLSKLGVPEPEGILNTTGTSASPPSM